MVASARVTEPGHSDSVDTVYGQVDQSAVRDLQGTYDLRRLGHCIAEFSEVAEYLHAESGLRDLLMRLYCMTATILCGSGVAVPPEDGDLRSVLSETRSDLEEAITFFRSFAELIEPLDRLTIEKR